MTVNTDILSLAKEYAYTAFRTRVHSLLIHINRAATMNTAVWQGETLVNWKWSAGTPDLTHRDAIRSPSQPGHTNTMALGTEPRRAANLQPVVDSLTRILSMKTVPTRIFFTNTGEVAVKMEFGAVPTKDRARTRGMLRLAAKEAVLFAGRL